MAVFLFLFIFQNIHAEYRAFELTITNSTTNQSRVVQTTLDHIQYPMYFHLQKDDRIQIASTWMCRNRTDQFMPICEKPAALQPPASPPSTGSQTATKGPPATAPSIPVGPKP